MVLSFLADLYISALVQVLFELGVSRSMDFQITGKPNSKIVAIFGKKKLWLQPACAEYQ